MPTTKDKRVRNVSPRVDGKRPRIKPRALDVDEHVRRGDEPIADTGMEVTPAVPKEGALGGA